jgi:hypothetical protein
MAMTRTTVTASDDTLELYQARDLGSAVIAKLAKGSRIDLGTPIEWNGREWMQATLDDGTVGYVLAPSARSHTTLGATLPPRSSPTLTERVAPKQREKGANAELWDCSICGSPATEKVIASGRLSRRFLSGEVCNGCGRVLCGECVKSLTSRICQCGGLFVSAPLDLRKKPLSLTVVGARAEGEIPESARTALGCLIITFVVALVVFAIVGIGQSGLTVTRTLRYAIITVGIIVATVGVRKKNNGLLLLGAAIIATGQMFFKY